MINSNSTLLLCSNYNLDQLQVPRSSSFSIQFHPSDNAIFFIAFPILNVLYFFFVSLHASCSLVRYIYSMFATQVTALFLSLVILHYTYIHICIHFFTPKLWCMRYFYCHSKYDVQKHNETTL